MNCKIAKPYFNNGNRGHGHRETFPVRPGVRRARSILGLAASFPLWLGGLAPATAAVGPQPVYSINPGACAVVKPSKLASQPAEDPAPALGFGLGRAGFGTGTAGELRLVCPIIGDDLAGVQLRRLEMLYRDRSGTSDPAGKVEVRLFRVEARTASPVASLFPLATVSSESQSCRNQLPSNDPFAFGGHTVCITSANARHEFDFDLNYYYLEVVLTRSDPSVALSIAGVKINPFIVE